MTSVFSAQDYVSHSNIDECILGSGLCLSPSNNDECILSSRLCFGKQTLMSVFW